MYRKTIGMMIAIMLLVLAGTDCVFAATNNDDDIATQTEEIVNRPDAVKKFKALSSSNAVVLKWKKVPNAKKYKIKWNCEGKKGSFTTTKTSIVHKVPVDKTYTYSIVAIDKNGNSSKSVKVKGEAVKTMYYQITFKAAVKLTTHTKEKYSHKFRANQTVVAKGFHGGRYFFDYKCKDGKTRTFYAMKIRIKNPKITHIDVKRTYSKEEAELYVNQKGISSATKYLIWANTYTQKEYIFKGKKGKWKLIKGPWLVSTGRATMPTSSGKTSIKSKSKSEHGIPLWNITSFFSIHGRASSWKMGWPRSGACVRNTNEHATWIYKNCPVRTGVYVY